MSYNKWTGECKLQTGSTGRGHIIVYKDVDVEYRNPHGQWRILDEGAYLQAFRNAIPLYHMPDFGPSYTRVAA